MFQHTSRTGALKIIDAMGATYKEVGLLSHPWYDWKNCNEGCCPGVSKFVRHNLSFNSENHSEKLCTSLKSTEVLLCASCGVSMQLLANGKSVEVYERGPNFPRMTPINSNTAFKGNFTATLAMNNRWLLRVV